MPSYDHNFTAEFICNGHEGTFEFTFAMKMTSPGSPESGPTYSSGGEPGEPAEWEIDEITFSVGDKLIDAMKLTEQECIALVGQMCFDKHLESAYENANESFDYNDDYEDNYF